MKSVTNDDSQMTVQTQHQFQNKTKQTDKQTKKFCEQVKTIQVSGKQASGE